MHTHPRNQTLSLLTRSLVLAATAAVLLLAQRAAYAADPSSLVKVSTNMGDFVKLHAAAFKQREPVHPEALSTSLRG